MYLLASVRLSCVGDPIFTFLSIKYTVNPELDIKFMSVHLSVRLSFSQRSALPSAEKNREESLSVQGVCMCVE